MTRKGSIIFALAAFLTSVAFAQEAEPAAGAEEFVPQVDPAMQAEISYIEALIDAAYPDLVAPLIEATKKRWPESEAPLFALEVRGMLGMSQFEAAEKKIASLPDRKGTKFWAARLEVALNYYARGRMADCMKIFEEFFQVFPKPPKDIFDFYIRACQMYGQLLARDRQYEKAATAYEKQMQLIKRGSEKWCDLGVETAELWLRLADAASDPKEKQKRDAYLKHAKTIADSLLWYHDLPLIFGRAVAMRAHIEQIKGNVDKAAETIDEHLDDLKNIHNQIVAVDPDGRHGLLRMSPLPECRYLQAKMRWDEAKKLAKDPKPDDNRIKDLMFGPKNSATTKRDGSKGAFNIAVSIFLKYDTSTWAPAAGELSEEIKAFAEKQYGAHISTKITPEQLAKVRASQYKAAHDLYESGDLLKAIEAFDGVLEKYPEYRESILAIERIARAYMDLSLDAQDAAKKEEYRINADAVEGYLAERFAGSTDRVLMTSAGDAVRRLAGKEKEYRNEARAEQLYLDFITNYREHTAAPPMAAKKAEELRAAEKYADAIRYYDIVVNNYSNTVHYAPALAQLSYCHGKLGNGKEEIEYIAKYLDVETVKIRRLQAQFQLAQMYQRDGLAILKNAETNATPEGVEADENRGTAQIIRAIKQFQSFQTQAEKEAQDPGTPPGEAERYRDLREKAMFIIGECWSRMNRPEKNLQTYRERAAKSYEDYLQAYPEGMYAKYGYVKLSSIYTALNDMEKSKDALDRLSQKFPDSDEAKNAKPRLAKSLIEMGMKREGAEIYAEMLRTDGAYTARQFLDAGESLVEGRNWQLANQAFEKAIRLAGTNSATTVAKARLGQATTAWKQGSLVEAREALDLFLQDANMSRLAIAADANFMMVEIASAQGRTEKDEVMRDKHFGAALGALKKVRQYWGKKEQWEQDMLSIKIGEVFIDRMKAEEAMGLKEAALETCGRAASTFLSFIQSHGPTDEHPLSAMSAHELENLENAYALMLPLLAKKGGELSASVLRYGQEYLDMFPNGKARTEVSNSMNKARAEVVEDSGAATTAPAANAAPTEKK